MDDEKEAALETCEKEAVENMIDDPRMDTTSTPPPAVTFKKPMIFGPRPGLKKVQKKNILEDEEKLKNNSEKQTLEKHQTEKSKTEKKPEQHSSKPAKPVSSSGTTIPYKEPSWSGVPHKPYNLEVLKGGVIADTVDLTTKAFHVFGRLPSCDITLEHPSLSRYHAVLQYCAVENEKHEVGWYIYDLDSTHGTWANKAKLNPNTYYRLRVGHVVKFGGSSRLYILQGPEDDQESESEFSVTELKQQQEKQKKELEVLRHAEEMKSAKPVEEDTGCSWGMGDDAVDDDEPGDNPFAELPAENEELYLDDPKKALRGYFEREGLELPEYEVQENGFGKYKCTVELPIDDKMGRPIMAEAIVSGKKKEAVAQCALEACRILDRHGVLRQAKHESRKRKKKNWEEEDFYDSDDDSFLDRTGNIEKKRKERMKRAGKLEEKVQTYESLVTRMNEIVQEIEELEKQLEKAKAAACQSDDIDDIDAYVNSIKSGEAMDSKTRMKLKRQIFELRQEQQKVQKLINIARPADLPPAKSLPTPKEVGSQKPKQVPMFGKKLLTPVIKPSKSVAPVVTAPTEGSVVEEEDDEDEKTTTSCDNGDMPKEGMNKGPKNVLKQDSGETGGTQTVDLGRLERGDEKSEIKKHDISEKVLSATVKRKMPDKPSVTTKVPKEPKLGKQYCDSDPDYDLWVPPTDQAGDGTTSLNAKFGY